MRGQQRSTTRTSQQGPACRAVRGWGVGQLSAGCMQGVGGWDTAGGAPGSSRTGGQELIPVTSHVQRK